MRQGEKLRPSRNRLQCSVLVVRGDEFQRAGLRWRIFTKKSGPWLDGDAARRLLPRFRGKCRKPTSDEHSDRNNKRLRSTLRRTRQSALPTRPLESCGRRYKIRARLERSLSICSEPQLCWTWTGNRERTSQATVWCSRMDRTRRAFASGNPGWAVLRLPLAPHDEPSQS
jgi:hypothetical protein